MSYARRFIAALLSASLASTSLMPVSGAVAAPPSALISAEEVVAAPEREPRAALLALLNRDDVARALAERGVDPAQARLRVQSLTDAEAARLMGEIDRAPAGAGDLVGTLVFIFVLLLITDILGFTHIFPFVRPVR